MRIAGVINKLQDKAIDDFYLLLSKLEQGYYINYNETLLLFHLLEIIENHMLSDKQKEKLVYMLLTK